MNCFPCLGKWQALSTVKIQAGWILTARSHVFPLPPATDSGSGEQAFPLCDLKTQMLCDKAQETEIHSRESDLKKGDSAKSPSLFHCGLQECPCKAWDSACLC